MAISQQSKGSTQHGDPRLATDHWQPDAKHGIMYPDFAPGQQPVMSDSDIRSRKDMQSGRTDGVSRAKFPNGRLAFQESYRDGKKNGSSVYYGPDGNREYSLNYKNGKLDGPQIHWETINGQSIVREVNYKDGKRDGLSRTWVDGRLIVEMNYKNDKLDGQSNAYLSGRTLSTEFSNGHLAGANRLTAADEAWRNDYDIQNLLSSNFDRLSGEQPASRGIAR